MTEKLKYKVGDKVLVKTQGKTTSEGKIIIIDGEYDRFPYWTKYNGIKMWLSEEEIAGVVPVIEESKTVQHDAVENPSHYQGRFGLEAIEVHRNFMKEEQVVGYHLGNTLKYLLRYQNKNGLEDLKKAKVHLEWLIGEYEKKVRLDETNKCTVESI